MAAQVAKFGNLRRKLLILKEIPAGRHQNIAAARRCLPQPGPCKGSGFLLPEATVVQLQVRETMNSFWDQEISSRGRWLGLLYLYAALMGWHLLTARSVSITIAAGLCAAVLVAFFLGDILLKLVLKDKAGFDTLSFRLLGGVLMGITLLYLAALVLNFGLIMDAVIVAGAVTALWAVVRRGCWKSTLSGGDPAESLVLALGLLAVTIWCRDLLGPLDSTGSVTIIPAWPDVFYHMSQITAFAGSTGAASIHDVQMAGSTVHPYHFASYVVPALLVRGGDVSEAVAYASFLVPVGIMLTFLAAHAIAAPLFGARPAAAAALALLLLPDASQQNFGNPFMAYHWLQQIAPASGYGVAAAAMSFLLMIEACRSRRVSLIFASYAFLIATLVFKAQIFVAIAYLLLIFPALFFGGLTILQRTLSTAVLTTVFVAVVRFSQQFPGVPVLRLDGSSLLQFASAITGHQSEGVIYTFFAGVVPITGAHGLVLALMLLLVTFGIFPFVYAFLLKRLRRQFDPIVWLFPIFIVANFLVMAAGLALDNRHIGMPEELLHRPFVWAYFVMLVWTTAAAYRLYFGDALPGRTAAIRWGICIAVLMVAVPGYFGALIQTRPTMGRHYPLVASCLVKSAGFIKENSPASDIVQDANNDSKFVLEAFSARMPYAIDAHGIRAPNGVQERLLALVAMRNTATLEQAAAMSRQAGIQWWLVGPGSGVAWSPGASPQAAFTCGNYQVFHFATASGQ